MLLARFSSYALATLILTFPIGAWALPHTIFNVRPGTVHDALADGTVPQGIVTVMLSNSTTACNDWQTQKFQPGKQYLLARLSAQPTGDALSGCYQVSGRGDCMPPRGSLDGIEFVGAGPESYAGKVVQAKFLTGGHIKVDSMVVNDDGTGLLRGFANVLLGDIATGGVVEADFCPPFESQAGSRSHR